MKFLVTYDIEDNKIRKKISDILEEYGIRVNKSVFEIKVTQTQLKKLLVKLEVLKEDNIRFYHLCQNCIQKSFSLDGDVIFKELDLFV